MVQNMVGVQREARGSIGARTVPVNVLQVCNFGRLIFPFGVDETRTTLIGTGTVLSMLR